jgi:hypothetical protein
MMKQAAPKNTLHNFFREYIPVERIGYRPLTTWFHLFI